MKNKKLFLPLLLSTLVLGGCNPAASEGGNGSSVSDSTVLTSDGQLLIDQGYTQATGWPTAVISTYLSDMGTSIALPAFSTDKGVFYAEYFDEQLFMTDIVEIAVLDGSDATIKGFQSILEGASFLIDETSEAGVWFLMADPTETVYVYAEVFAAEDGWPAATHFFIASGVETEEPDGEDSSENPEEPSGEIQEHLGWPAAAIASYLSGVNNTEVVPALSVSSVSYSQVITDEEQPYIYVFIPGEDRTTEYIGILEAAGYTVQEDTEFAGYYAAYSPSYLVIVEFEFYPEDELYEGGFDIWVTGYEGEGTGEVVVPENPEGAITLSFASEASIVGGKNTLLTTWSVDGLSFAIAKNKSTVNVGNFENPSKPEGYFTNPLRVYTAQSVTITATGAELLQQINFKVDAAHANSVTALSDSAPAGVTVTVNGDTVQFVLSTPAASIELLVSGQFRLMELTAYFA